MTDTSTYVYTSIEPILHSFKTIRA